MSAPLPGPDNMALDEALMRHAERTGEGLLRLYGWSERTLSLGRHQTARGRYDLARAAELGVRFVRRPTGGRAVLHHREITYAVAAPADALGTLAQAYRWVNRLLLASLARLGVAAVESQPASPMHAPGVAPCFQQPAAGEIEAGGRKLVGSAQVREGSAMLQHGSILLEDDQWLAAALLASCDHAPPPRAATLRSLLGRAPTVDEMANALTAALADAAPQVPVVPLEEDRALVADAQRLRLHYADDAWTWRR